MNGLKRMGYFLFGWSARALATVLFSTCRVTVIGREIEEKYRKYHPGKGLLYASWHRGLMYFVYFYRFQGFVVMASASEDGELAAQATRRFGWIPVRGSSTRRGAVALREMQRLVEQGRCGGLVVDAPTGPACVSKIGIVMLARRTGLPIVPVMWSADRFWRLKSWDRTLIPKPFSRVVFMYGSELMHVPTDADRELCEARRQTLDGVLNEMMVRADRYFQAAGIDSP